MKAAQNLLQIILARIRTIWNPIRDLTATILKFVWAFTVQNLAPRVSNWSADRWLYFFFQVGLFIIASIYIALFFWHHIKIVLAAQ